MENCTAQGDAESELKGLKFLVRVHLIIVMIRWTGFAPWEFEFPFSGSLTSTFLAQGDAESELKGLKFLRILKPLRILKMLRLLKVSLSLSLSLSHAL